MNSMYIVWCDISASSWISWGIEKGAEKAGQYIRVGSEKIKEKLKPEEHAKQIDPRVQQGVHYVRRGTHVAVKVSSYVGKYIARAYILCRLFKI